MAKLAKHDLRFKDLDGDGDVDYIRFTGGGAHVVLGPACLAFNGGSDLALARTLLKSVFGHLSGSKTKVAVPCIMHR
jgi:hypothetical protein